MNICYRRAERGFTLVELVISVTIIAVLASVVTASVSQARSNARNKARLADIEQIRLGLEVYKQVYGEYPVQNDWRGTTPGCSGTGDDPSTSIPGLTPNIMTSLPRDPRPIDDDGCYIYRSDGTDYKVVANGTVEGDPLEPGDENARYPVGCGAAENSYAVYSGGAACW